MARRTASSFTPSESGQTTFPSNAARDRSSDDHLPYISDPMNATNEAKFKSAPFDPSLSPSGKRSLSSIGLQAFGLGFVLSACLISTAWLVFNRLPIWRLPAFFACLSLFHFLEYWTTAHFNVRAVDASSFLLFSNGTAYNVAHTLAAVEILLSSFVPPYQFLGVSEYSIAVGIGLVVIGQLVRSIAMAHAGTNFNHTLQKVRKEDHELVTDGIYHWLRHPSYFGFFWWALGTQVLVGNKICLLGYSLALWTFFSRRIRSEENHLVLFFGQEYEAYRKQTRIGIPFIR